MSIRIFAVIFLFALSSLSPARAQPFPNQPIKIIVAFGPGSGGDLLARMLANQLQPELGTPIVVENRVGALGQIATTALARAKPDGYTLGMGSSSTHSTSQFLTKNLPYDPLADFSAVGGLNSYTFILLVNAESGITTPEQLVTAMKRKNGGFSGYGNASGRVGAAHFKKLAGLNTSEIAYKSSPDALVDLSAGRVDYVFTDAGSSKSFVESGKLRPIAVMSDSRSSVLPNLPAIGETYPGFNFDNWGGLMAPKGTPIEVIQVLNSALRKVLDKPDVKARMTAMGLEVKPSSPEELTELVQKQHKAWGDAILGAGIEPQ